MALDQSAVIQTVRDLVATVSGVANAYSSADSDDTRLPAALSLASGAAAIVLPGATLEYVLQPGKHRHTYEVRIQILSSGGDEGVVSADLAPMPDRVLEVMALNVKLGSLVTYIHFTRSEGLKGFEYGGYDNYSGYELVYTASEEASASPAAGA